MKRVIISVLSLIGAAALLTSCASEDHPQTAVAGGQSVEVNPVPPAPGSGPMANLWPLRFNDQGTDFTVFEPQYDSWDGHQLSGRCAVAIQGPH